MGDGYSNVLVYNLIDIILIFFAGWYMLLGVGES